MATGDKTANGPKEIEGMAKEVVGKANDDHDRKAEGHAHHAKGNLKQGGEGRNVMEFGEGLPAVDRDALSEIAFNFSETVRILFSAGSVTDTLATRASQHLNIKLREVAQNLVNTGEDPRYWNISESVTQK